VTAGDPGGPAAGAAGDGTTAAGTAEAAEAAEDDGVAGDDGGEAAGPVLRVRELKQYYPVRSGILDRRVGDVKAVDGVSFDVYPGETLAVVGESGCGKSTLAETILRLHEPTAGSVRFRGTDLADLSGSRLRAARREMAMVFQDPRASLNGRMTAGKLIAEPLVIHDADVGDRRAHVRELMATVGLDPDDHYDRFPHELSGGQCQRIGIARALALRPSLLIADEPVSALDVSIQASILDLLDRLQTDYDLTYLFVSHDMSVVRHIADRVAVMYLGRIVELADVETLFADPQHPYTEALLSSVPTVTADATPDRIALDGSPPDPIDPPDGCHFHPRCHLKPDLAPAERERCEAEDPRIDPPDDARGPEAARAARGCACHFRPD